MSQIVPLAAVPSQTLNLVLGGQNCQLAVYQRPSALYLDLVAAGVPILTGMICRNAARLLLDRTYLPFIGDLVFVDTRVTELLDGTDPVYTGFGSQYQLIYLTGDEVASL